MFVDQLGNYWDVPFAFAFDLASVAAESGLSYHLLINHNTGSPKQGHGQSLAKEVPPSLLRGFCAKGAVSLKESIGLWRGESSLLKMVQPYDILLSSPRISATGILGVPRDLHKSLVPSTEAIQAVCPNAMVSIQQQIAGPFSLRVDSELAIDARDSSPRVNNPIFALEYALKALGIRLGPC